jgi:molecular chaperone DnaK
MKKDAELHAEDDKKRRELVEMKNQGDALIHATEKSLKDLGDKVDAETKGNVEKEIENLKTALQGDDVAAIKSATEALTAASHKLAELMYAQAAKDNPDGGGPEGGAGTGGDSQQNKGDDDVVDADYEEVK